MEHIKAFIFDMDGVIVDSMPLHVEIWKSIFEKRGIPFSDEIFQRYNGTSSPQIAEMIISEYSLSDTVGSIMSEKRCAEEEQQDKRIRLFPGAKYLLLRLKQENYRLALATSATPEMLEYIDSRFEIRHLFDEAVDSGMVSNTKPDPEIFLLAASKLGIEPRYCAVVEDALNGIAAAHHAGMFGIAITTTFPKQSFESAGIKPDLIITELEDIDILLKGLKRSCNDKQ